MYRDFAEHKLYNMERIWFAEQAESDADIVRYLRTRNKISGFFVDSQPVETVFSDISNSTEEILAASTKTIKYEVNKCEKEEVCIKFYQACDILQDISIVNEFEKAYIDFAKDLGKDVLNAYQRDKIESYIKARCILISRAEKEDIIVYHVYTWGGTEACLTYSVSNFRNDSANRNLAGRMNKLLHIKDIDFLRANGVTLYDWGNISSSANPNGIDKFKMSFGGEVLTVYNSFVGNTIKGKLLVLLIKIKTLL